MLIYGLAFGSAPRAKEKEGVAPGSNTAVAAQLQHSTRENLRLEREIQDLKRTQRHDAAARNRLVPALGETLHAPASSLSVSLAAQSALTSLGSSKQMKKLFQYELMTDVYLRDGKPQEALAKMFPSLLAAADSIVVMASPLYTKTHSHSQTGGRRRFWKNGGRYSLVRVLHLLIDTSTFSELFYCVWQFGSVLMKSTR